MVALLAGRRRRPSGCARRATERPPRLESSRAWMSLGAQRIANVSCSGKSCCIAGQLEPVLKVDSLRCSSLGSCRGRSSRPARRRQPSQRLLWPSTSMSPLSSRQPALKQTRPASLAVREMRLTAPPAELLSSGGMRPVKPAGRPPPVYPKPPARSSPRPRRSPPVEAYRQAPSSVFSHVCWTKARRRSLLYLLCYRSPPGALLQPSDDRWPAGPHPVLGSVAPARTSAYGAGRQLEPDDAGWTSRTTLSAHGA
jgi:hypothetical protein